MCLDLKRIQRSPMLGRIRAGLGYCINMVMQCDASKENTAASNCDAAGGLTAKAMAMSMRRPEK